jgi:hypothetical protein
MTACGEKDWRLGSIGRQAAGRTAGRMSRENDRQGAYVVNRQEGWRQDRPENKRI